MEVGTIKVQVQGKCPDCGGTGCHYSPEWEEWGRAHDEAEAAAEAKLGQDAPRAAVISYTEVLLAEGGHVPPTGPEEPPCVECEGTGVRRKLVTLAELVALLREAEAGAGVWHAIKPVPAEAGGVQVLGGRACEHGRVLGFGCCCPHGRADASSCPTCRGSSP